MSDWTTDIIEEFRANGGAVTTMGFGRGLVLLNRTGARTGTERDEAWAGLPAMSEGFRSYEERTTRVIPVLSLTRR